MPNNKQILCSRSFGKPVKDVENLAQAIASHISRGAVKLRKQKSKVAVIHIFIHTNRFKDEPQYHKSISYALPRPTSYTPELISYGVQLLHKIYREGYRYKKAGIIFSDLILEKNCPSHLFADEGEEEKNQALMEAVDEINQRFGRNTIRSGTFGFDHPWRMRRELLSKRFTTKWDELLKVKV